MDNQLKVNLINYNLQSIYASKILLCLKNKFTLLTEVIIN